MSGKAKADFAVNYIILMKALILAAGYAVRLYPLTKRFPKPLLKVAGKPIIDYIVERLALIDDIDEIIVVTNNRFIGKFHQWHKSRKSIKKITIINDLTMSPEDRLGAIGDIYFSIKKNKIKEDILVVGGDNLLEDNLGEFLKFSGKKKNKPVIGVYDIKDKSEATKYGVIKLNKDKRIVDFQEKPGKPKSSLVAMCLYYFPKGKLNLFNEYMADSTNRKDATGFYIDWLRKKETVYGFIFNQQWFDIGDRKFYDQANKTFSN